MANSLEQAVPVLRVYVYTTGLVMGSPVYYPINNAVFNYPSTSLAPQYPGWYHVWVDKNKDLTCSPPGYQPQTQNVGTTPGDPSVYMVFEIRVVEEPPPPPPPQFEPDKSDIKWVRYAFVDVLGRQISDDDARRWIVSQAEHFGWTTRADMTYPRLAGEIIYSEEYIKGIINRWYTILQQRPADPSGLTYFHRRLTNPASFRSYISGGFGYKFQDFIFEVCISPEYNSRYPTNEDFIRSLIRNLLGWEPQESEVDRHPIRSGFVGRADSVSYFFYQLDPPLASVAHYPEEYSSKNARELVGRYLGASSSYESNYKNEILRTVSILAIEQAMITGSEYWRRLSTRP